MMLLSSLVVYFGTLAAVALIYRRFGNHPSVKAGAAYAGTILAVLSGLFWIFSATVANQSMSYNDSYGISSAWWNMRAAWCAYLAAILLIVPFWMDRRDAAKRKRALRAALAAERGAFRKAGSKP